MKAALPLVALCALAGCGRYEDFTLPYVDRPPEAGTWVWEARPEPVLGLGAAGEFDRVDALNPSVVRHSGTLFNYYSGFDGTYWHTGLAVSEDEGLTWRKRGALLSPPAGGYIAANGSALRLGSETLYWYQAGKVPRMELARFPDGKAAQRHPGPVLDLGPRGSWDERGVADPYIVRFGGAFYAYYLGQDRAKQQRLGVARSPDGITWTKLRANPVLELGEAGSFDENGLGEPAVWFWGGSYWMLYTGRDRNEVRRMGLAQSRDGVRWTKLPSTVITGDQPWNRQVVCDATVEVRRDGVHVWFGGGDRPKPDERLNGQIGYAILRWQPR
ncbi:MAG: hypothetical protein JNK87_05180 [Bryobacterales bacterium]|nr:hypothetical protein [Bryobacterales bacterium]